MPERSARRQHRAFDMPLDPLGDLRRVYLEVLQQNLLLPEKTLDSLRVAQRRVAAEDHAVETRKHSGNRVLVLGAKRVIGCNGRHGVFSERVAILVKPSSLKKTPFSFLFWLRLPLCVKASSNRKNGFE